MSPPGRPTAPRGRCRRPGRPNMNTNALILLLLIIMMISCIIMFMTIIINISSSSSSYCCISMICISSSSSSSSSNDDNNNNNNSSSSSSVMFIYVLACRSPRGQVALPRAPRFSSCDIHTHTPARKSYTNLKLYYFVIRICYANCLGHAHGQGYECHI